MPLSHPEPLPEAVTLPEALERGLCEARVVLADLDGCLVAGERALPGAAALVARAGARLWIVSNNSTDTAPTLARRLARLGLAVGPERLVLAGEATLRRIAAEAPGARVALFAAEPLQGLARDLGLVHDRARPDLALLARDTGFGFADLAELIALAHRGVPLWLANGDATHPGPAGVPQPETGALFAALAAAVPGLVPACLAKPAPDLIHAALARAGAAPAEAVFLGDTPATDGEAARRAGVRFVRIAAPGPAAPHAAEAV
jgi:pyridoxal phosphatase